VIRFVWLFVALVLCACGGGSSLRDLGNGGAGSAGSPGLEGRAGGEVAAGLPQWYCLESDGACLCELLDHPGSLHPCTGSYVCCLESAAGDVCSCGSDAVCAPGDGRRVARCPAFLGES
jgi:hypothetical protein